MLSNIFRIIPFSKLKRNKGYLSPFLCCFTPVLCACAARGCYAALPANSMIIHSVRTPALYSCSLSLSVTDDISKQSDLLPEQVHLGSYGVPLDEVTAFPSAGNSAGAASLVMI